jgi:hypothetical protein
MSHICANDEYRSQVGATNRLKNIVIRYVSFISVSSICIYVFEFESSQHFQFLFTDFSLVYLSAFAGIFPRSQPIRASNTSTVHLTALRVKKKIKKNGSAAVTTPGFRRMLPKIEGEESCHVGV